MLIHACTKYNCKLLSTGPLVHKILNKFNIYCVPDRAVWLFDMESGMRWFGSSIGYSFEKVKKNIWTDSYRSKLGKGGREGMEKGNRIKIYLFIFFRFVCKLFKMHMSSLRIFRWGVNIAYKFKLFFSYTFPIVHFFEVWNTLVSTLHTNSYK